MSCGIHMPGSGGIGGRTCPLCALAMAVHLDTAPTAEARGKAAARAKAAMRAMGKKTKRETPWRQAKACAPRVLVPVRGDTR